MISAFHAQGSGGKLHRGRIGCCGRGRRGQGGHAGSGGRGEKPNISAKSYTDQEWALIRYKEKGKVFLSVINMNRERSMWLRYWRSQSLRSPILRTDRTLFGQPRGRKRVPVTVLLARLVAVHNMLLCGVWSDSYWKSI